jgi:uncharacterized membrane protein
MDSKPDVNAPSSLPDDYEAVSKLVDAHPEVVLKQVKTRYWVQETLAMVITVGFFGLLILTILHHTPENSDIVDLLLGSLGTAWITVINFYFGASHNQGTQAASPAPKDAKGQA